MHKIARANSVKLLRNHTFLLAFNACALTGISNAYAQNAGDMMNLFGGLMRGAIVEGVRADWRKIRPPELACIEQELQKQGTSTAALTQQGILPADGRIAGIRAGCATAAISARPPLSQIVQPAIAANPQPLSATPTFDCTKAKSGSGLILCSDQAGAKADWDIDAVYWANMFSLPEANRDAFTRAHEDWVQSVNRTCRLLPEQSAYMSQQRQCVLTAFRKRTDAYRARLKGDALAESKLNPEQHAEIQSALITLGLLDGTADGEFGEITRRAIKRFQDQNGEAQDEFLTAPQQQQLVQGKAPAGTAQANSSLEHTESSSSPLPVHKNLYFTDSYLRDTLPVPIDLRPIKETAKLKEARVFLEDIQKFVAGQKTVPSISAIAKEAANLQIAISKFDEAGAVQSMAHLSDLLKPISGFQEFAKQQQDDRRREDARRLAEASSEGNKNVYFIDSYLRENLGDSKTASLIGLRDQISDSQKRAALDEITKANDALQAFVTDNGLSNAYQSTVADYANPATPKGDNSATLQERLGITDKSKFLVEGPTDEIALLYNASPTAPNVWINVRGDKVFQNDTGSLCFAHTNTEIGMLRYTERVLGEQGAKKITLGPPRCNLSMAASLIDIIAFERGELLKEREDYIRELVKLVNGDSFHKYQIISNYAAQERQLQTLSLRIESDVEKDAREGFGVIAVSDQPVACVVPPTLADQVDGIKELLRRNQDSIAPKLESDLQFVDTTVDLAYFGLQRKQCGYVAGEASVLKGIIQALLRDHDRDQVKYTFSPVWFSKEDVAQATFDTRDAREQAIRKVAIEDQQKQAQGAIDAARLKNQQSTKSAIEQGLRERNGVRARGLMNGISDFVRGLADKRLDDVDHRFPTYLNWLNKRFSDQWDTFNVTSDIADFGTVQWKGRSLDAIIVKSTIQQKNRILGQYDDACFMFGLVDDVEFTMQRDLFAVDCSSGGTVVNKWKIGEKFQSQWNAN
jgi:uncharacterized protein